MRGVSTAARAATIPSEVSAVMTRKARALPPLAACARSPSLRRRGCGLRQRLAGRRQPRPQHDWTVAVDHGEAVALERLLTFVLPADDAIEARVADHRAQAAVAVRLAQHPRLLACVELTRRAPHPAMQ